MMTFEEILDQAVDMLQRRGRVAYRALKRQFEIDDDYLDDLKETICYEYPQVVEDGEGLVWQASQTSAHDDQPETPPEPTSEPELSSYTPKHLADQILQSKGTLEGERKHVTVLFADIKGSTELIEGLDPEDARRLLDPVLHLMMDAVHRYEGTVNQVLGDGIMSLFGAPLAHEDHAVRACYAALAMQSAMRDYVEEVGRSHGIEMQIRVGLNSGDVVVRAIGNDLHMDYSAVGQTTHLAARMEQLATPGSIRLTAATLRLVEGFVQVNALGQYPVKGLSEPVDVFELVRASHIRRRFQAATTRGLTQFIGRQSEMETLVQALGHAAAGRGQVVATVGEPGVGKSRLVYEFVQSHQMQDWFVLESASASYSNAMPYFPVIELLKRYMHVEDEDEPRTVRAKVTGQILTLDEALQETIPPLLSLLNVLPDDSPFLQLEPPQRRQRTLEALKQILLRESQVQPLLLVLEDLHWIDSETQALLDSLVESLPTAQLLLMVNYRPEYQHQWGSRTYYTQLRLDPLAPENVEAFLTAMVGDHSDLAPLKQLLLERTEGNPFFLEESIRTLVETRALTGEPGAYHLRQALSDIQVPATVQAILAARIDRLSREEKSLLQTAAVIGTDVPFDLLQAIAAVPVDELNAGLTQLTTSEFIYETRLFPTPEYTFKHALTHDVAYGSLLQERRQALHAQIVEALECLEAERLSEQAERLAYHAGQGEVWDKVVIYARQAGAKASARSLHRDAVGHYEQVLTALDHLPASREATEQAIDVRFELCGSYTVIRDFDRVGELLQQAESLATDLQDQYRLGQLSAYMSRYLWATVNHERSVEAGQRAAAVARELEDIALQVVANTTVAFAYHDLAAYDAAIDLSRQTLALLEGDLIRERFGWPQLPSVFCRGTLAWCLSWKGEFKEAIALHQEAGHIARAVDHPGSILYSQLSSGLMYLLKGDLDEANLHLEGYMAMHPSPPPAALSFLAHTYALAGRVDEALELFETSLEQAAAIKFLPCNSLWIGWWSEAALMSGHVDDAMQHATHALDISLAQKEQGYEAHALRQLGNIAAYGESPNVETAETHYHRALNLAENLGMRPLQAHCHLNLGMLYSNIDRVVEAQREVTTALRMYRDMNMTFWQPEAESLLAQVQTSSSGEDKRL